MIRKVSNPPNAFSKMRTEWFDVPPDAPLEIFEEHAKSIISENKSPDIGFRFSLNPYRGCFHGCAYCYARPSHQYLDFGAGTDFERKIVVKVNAPELLRRELSRKSWNGEQITFSGVTDCYQPAEATYEITRKCLEVCIEMRNPVTIITKGALVQRDIPLLQELGRCAAVKVYISLAFADGGLARKFEPSTPSPSARLRTIRALADAGIPVGVSASPVIPGANDVEVPRILELAAASGATSAFMTLLRLPAEVQDVFFERVEDAYPERAKKIRSGVLAMKNGKLNRSQFGERFVGTGPRWEAIQFLFRSSCEKYGLAYRSEAESWVVDAPTRQRDTSSSSSRAQLELFPKTR